MASKWEEELRRHVADQAADIIRDEVPSSLNNRSYRVEAISTGDDDGTAYGEFDIVLDDDSLHIRVSAHGYFAGEADCWNSSTESHYTKPVQYDELHDVEVEMLWKRVELQRLLDKAIDVDLDHAEHEMGGC